MSNLREEYKRNKEAQQTQLDEASLNWVGSNVILIHEKMNRRAVQRLIDEISKFESKFGPYKEKLPVISNVLDNAENGLMLVLTGKTSDKKAGDMLQQMSFVYNNLSSFFSRDLPLILKTPILRVAAEHPDVRLDSLNLPGFDPDVARKTFVHAIIPTKDEERLLRKILKTSKVPHIEATSIAMELLTLSYRDLEMLSEIEKVSLAVPAPEPVAPTAPVVGENNVKKNSSDLISEAIDLEKMKVLNQRISEILGSIKPYQADMPQTTKAVNAASKAILKAAGQGIGGAAAEKLKGVFGVDTNSQVINLYTMFYNFKQSWPQIKKSVENIVSTDDANVENTAEVQNDLALIKKILIKAVTPGLIKGTKAFTFLSPDVFAQELTNIVHDEKSGKIDIQALDTLASKTSKLEKPQQVNPTATNAPEQTQGTQATDGTTGTTSSQGNDPNAQTASSQGTGTTAAITGDNNTKAITSQILKSLNSSKNANAIRVVNSVMSQINKLGYDLVKR